MAEGAIELPTSNGSMELSEATFGSRCASGCRTMGGGMLFVRVRDPRGSIMGEMTFCGNCVAGGLVGAINAVRDRRSEEAVRDA